MTLDGIKLVASDMDGTLLLDGPMPDPRIFGLVERLYDARVPFFAASGRTHHSLRALFEPVADKIGYVCENGSMVVLDGKVLVSHAMPRGLALRIIEAVMNYPHAKVSISGTRCMYVEDTDPDFAEWQRREIRNKVEMFGRPEDIDDDILKISFFIPPEEQADAFAYFERELVGEDISIVTSGHDWLDFIPHGIDKGSALAEVGRALGIDPADMAAFGDNENDRQMMELVGHPFLMDPCNPTMLDIATKRPQLRRCTRVEDTLEELLG